MVSTGGEAKHLIAAGLIYVNGVLETRRGRKLFQGDKVLVGEEELIVLETDPGAP